MFARAFALVAARRPELRRSYLKFPWPHLYEHPVSVAGIITELRLDTASVCAGLLHDVVEDTLASSKDLEKHFGSERFVALFRLIVGLPKPTVCAADGYVLAGALGIALACDLIVASEKATFGTPEINVGTFPFMIMALIYRNVPRKKANELLLLGERWSAQEALVAGIVNRVVPDAELDGLVADWSSKLAGKSPVIMRLGKEAMRRQLDMPLDDALDFLRAQLSLAMSTEDIVEGVSAFFEKREPQWKGR